MEVGGQRHTPAALPPGKTRYPLYRRRGGPQSRSGQVRKISPPKGFDPQTIQPVASRYTYRIVSPNIPKTLPLFLNPFHLPTSSYHIKLHISFN